LTATSELRPTIALFIPRRVFRRRLGDMPRVTSESGRVRAHCRLLRLEKNGLDEGMSASATRRVASRRVEGPQEAMRSAQRGWSNRPRWLAWRIGCNVVDAYRFAGRSDCRMLRCADKCIGIAMARCEHALQGETFRRLTCMHAAAAACSALNSRFSVQKTKTG
jgi:hypothetical protein